MQIVWLIHYGPAGRDVQLNVFRFCMHKIMARGLVNWHCMRKSYSVTSSHATSKERNVQPSSLETRFLRDRVLITPFRLARGLAQGGAQCTAACSIV
jgi:hypothetical protein